MKSTIRIASEEDAEKLLEIYAPYVENTAISFEYDVPSLDEFRSRIGNTLKKYPYLIAEQDGEIVGYTYASSFHQRAAYAWGAETSIYVRMDKRGSGIGRELYEAMEYALVLQNVLNVNACIGYPSEEDEYLTKNSVQFHEHMGYRFVGEFHKCGYKFNRWYNIAWVEKKLGEHLDQPTPVTKFAEIQDQFLNWLKTR